MSASPAGFAAWKRLSRLATARVDGAPASLALTVEVAGLHVDFSRQTVDGDVLDALTALAEEAGLPAAIEAMFTGAVVNVTEDRPALHTALRALPRNQPGAVRDEIASARQRQETLVDALRSGQWRGYTDKPMRTLVHVGIGGSHLGPELIVEALGSAHPIACRFLANIDSRAVADLVDGLDPETTLFVIASKSFSTLETRVNAEHLRAWFLERSLDTAAIERHFIAVTARPDAAAAFGIPAANVLPMWDWVGGRYSLWSAIGLPIAVSLGNDAFAELLEGARQLDEHFRSTPAAGNAPMLMALIEIWNSNFLGAQSHALLCYDRRLAGLVNYLQQLEMESTGKTTRRDGERTEVHTAPILWGGEETNSQHAFHQLLHQGSRAYSADFVACIEPGHESGSHPTLDAQHRWLLANCLAQGEAMSAGRDDGPAHARVPGGHPSTTILLDELNPATLGALLALYEHKVYCQGMIWDINPFDQWGVELGKRLSDAVYAGLGGERSTISDSATRALINRIRASRSME